MQVLKFGGSSVCGATNISRVLDIVGKAVKRDRLILVCSAISGCTDALLALARTEREGAERAVMLDSLKSRHMDIVRRLFTGAERDKVAGTVEELFQKLSAAPEDEMVTFGEVLSTVIIAEKLRCEGWRTKWLDSRILVIKDNPTLTYNNISTAVALEPAVEIFVAPGFIASEYDGKVTTLGRGGSDYSAALYAAAVKASRLEIWTDVPGIMTANPKTVPAARTIPEMPWQAALDMATHGAKVLYAPTVEPAREAGIAIHILSSFEPDKPGTVVKDIPYSGVPGWIGVTSTEDAPASESLLCLVGNGSISGEASCNRVEDCLRKSGIKTLSVSSDGTNVYASVRLAVEKEALRAIHAEFFESVPASTVKLFIAGYGAVGKAFVEMLETSSAKIARHNGKILSIAGIANSRSFAMDPEGIAPKDVPAVLDGGRSAAGGAFFSAVRAAAPRGSVFVDLTDSESIYKEYEALMREGLNIVSSNRRALSVPYVEYAAMHAAAQENGVFLRYETTVGSALPILESIAAGANSSDEIISMEAVVSCTLNRILSSFSDTPGGFAATVRKAQEDGLTEQDPRMDLGGRDALRKLLILAREAGAPLEEEDVRVTPIVGPEFFGGGIEDFYRRLEAAEPMFEAREAEARAKGCRQRFVASLEKDPEGPHGFRASIGLRLVDENHPAYRITGTENAIILRSAYHPSPLLIQGAGEGARLAAASVLNDILR